jgi:RNA polymerase sigma factor (sigma-70 family)
MSPKASTRLLATQSDERLVALVRAGHDRAFEALVQRYRAPLLRYCRRLRLGEGRAEDVVQQTFMQAWSALRRGAEVRELRPWLYRIAHNAYVNLMRDAGRDAVHQAVALDGLALDSTLTPTVQTGTSSEPSIPGGLALRETLNDMAALPQMQREVIFRTALAGQSHEEVALTLGISDGAVRGLLYRARATLRGAVTALTPPPLLAWMSSAGSSPTAERIGELAAGGGIGAGGVLVKGGLAALAATLLAGAAIVHSHLHLLVPHHASAKTGLATGRLADAHAGNKSAGYLAAQTVGSSVAVGGSATATVHKQSGGKRQPRSALERPDTSTQSRRGHAIHPGSPTTAEAPSTHAGDTYTVSVADPAYGAPAGSGQSGSGGGPTGSGGAGNGGGATGGGGGGAGNGGSGSGSGDGGGGAGAGSGGSGGGSAGGSSGGGSSGGGSGSAGGEGTGGGTGGTGGGGAGTGGAGGSGGGEQSSGSGSGAGSGESPGSGSAQSSGPVGTVVHEVTNLLEGTVSGLLGH